MKIQLKKKNSIKKEKVEDSENNTLIIEREYDKTKSDFKSKSKIPIHLFL